MTPLRNKTHPISGSTLILLIGLMTLSTLLFVIGVSLERSGEASESSEVHVESELEEQEETAETYEENSEIVESGEREEFHSETILGIDLESPVLVRAAVVVWLALTLGLWLIGSRLLMPIIIVALGTAFVDALEVINQLNRSNIGIALLAGFITVLRITVAVLAYRAWSASRTSQKAQTN